MNFRRILIRATNWVGDAIMSLPALLAVRRRFPDARITLLARPWVAGIYGAAVADDVVPYDAPRGWRGTGDKLRLAGQLRAERFDCAILLQNAFEAAAIAYAARIPRRIGYGRDARGWLLTDPVPVPAPNEIPRHQCYYYLELLRRAGILNDLPAVEAIRIPGAEARRDAGKLRFAELGFTGAVVGVSPGAAYGGAKRWLPERFVESACEAARALGAAVAVFGSGEEAALSEQVAALCRDRATTARSFAGATSIEEFVSLAAACAVFLTNDSGAMHIASALGVPTVAVFGATDDIATGPTGALARVVRESVECSPCLLRECPIDHRCMTRVSAARVVDEALDLVRIRGQ